MLFLAGFIKKACIADGVAPTVDRYFAHPADFTPASAWIGVLFYAIQIYCDFSGYTDIAIGISRIIGYDLPENFNMPYAATSIIDFWRRWHMTLSSWLRDYLYIPLGGNRKGRVRTYINLLITMLLGGLWHGASWTFVLWGLLHGVGLAVNRAWREATGAKGAAGWLGTAAGWGATYAFVTIAWVFFRAPTLKVSLDVLRKLLWIDQSGVVSPYFPLSLIVALVVVAHLVGIAMRKNGETDVVLPLHRFAGAFALTVWLVGLFLFSSIETKPFIYFRF
jgi:alginate O-acetyltransferase complex protein AlgI